MKIAIIATSILLLTAGSALAQTTKQAPPEKMATPSQQDAAPGSKYMHRRHLRRTNYATRKYRSRLNCDPIARQTLGVCW